MQTTVIEKDVERAGQQQRGNRRDRPRLFRPNQPFGNDLARHEVRLQSGHAEPLQTESIAHAKRQLIVLECRGRQHGRALQMRKGFDVVDVVTQILAEILLEARQFDRVAQDDHATNLGLPVDTLEIAHGPLHFCHQVVEHGLHRLEHELRILRLTRIALQVLRLGKRQLEFLGQLLREVVTAERHAPLPDSETVRDHEVRRVGPHRQDDQRRGRILRVILCIGNRVAQDVVGHKVVDAQRRKLNNVQFDVGVLKRLHRAIDLFTLHREKAHFGFQGKPVDFTATHLLEVPNDVFQREGDLLLGFELDNFRNQLRIDWRRLEELGQSALTGHRQGDLVTFQVVTRQKLLDGFPNHLLGFRLRLAEYLGVLDVIKCVGHHLAVLHGTAQRFKGRLTDINAPYAGILSHELFPQVRSSRVLDKRAAATPSPEMVEKNGTLVPVAPLFHAKA